MTLKEHASYGAVVSAALYPVFGWKSACFFFSSVMIDADHYIDYLYYSKFRDWSVKRMFRFHKQLGAWKHRKDLLALEAFHTAEFLLAFLAVGLTFKSPALLLIFGGFIFHLALDLVRLSQWKCVNHRALSFVEYAVRKRKMLRQGIHPEAIFLEAYEAVKEPAGMQVSSPFLVKSPA